jgi:uncharacterized protein (DUF427 family)
VPGIPPGAVYVEPHPRRIVALRGGRPVLDTEHALLVHRPGRTLSYAFPEAEVAHLPHEPEAAAPGYATVPWSAVDQWLEEGRLLVAYPPNPYHRVDCRPTRRRLTVEVGGRTVLDTDDTVILFETALAPRLYVDRSHLRGAALAPSDHATYCNYKGHASYWDLEVEGITVERAVWSYEDPLPESSPIAGLLSFDLERATVRAELPAS